MATEVPPKVSRRGAPKGDKRARTRAKLLAAARELVRERGFERTTLQDVAARAGMTSGAIYGNFKNREDLFIGLADAYWAPIQPKIRPGSTFAQKMRALAEATIAAIPDRREAAYGRLTGMAYAVTHEEMRARVQEVTAQRFRAGAAWLRSEAEPDELSMPPESLVCALHALTEGLLFQRFLTPELVPDKVFRAAIAALTAPPRPRPAARRPASSAGAPKRRSRRRG